MTYSKRFVLLFFFSVFFVSGIFSQFKNFEFIAPLDIPLYLSGNFGEIRGNHFHTGIDIKTGGVTGKKVYAIADGYISRIKIQENGYGNALYILHPNGYTSVYGHLENFSDDIKEYVIEKQYKNRGFAIDLYLEPGVFKVNQGDVIAFSGNSGGSSGPHLHFEIRDQYQHPVNVLKFPMNIKDDISPVFRSLFLYPVNNGTIGYGKDKVYYNVSKVNGSYTISGQPILISGEFGLGVEVYDYLNGSTNRCGIYTLELKIDDVLKNRFEVDKLDFSTIRYLNAHIDYEEKKERKRNVHKLYKLPNNKLDLYNFSTERGVIEIADTGEYIFTIVANDAYQNFSELKFKVKGYVRNDLPDRKADFAGTSKKMIFSEYNTFNRNDVKVSIPAGALYEDINFSYYKLEGENAYYADLHCIHMPNIPLQKYISVSLKPDTLIKQKSKMCIAKINDDELEYIDSKWNGDFIEASTRDFGKFTVVTDTIPPEILALNFRSGEIIVNKKRLEIIIRDNFSGIKDFSCSIDNKWALFAYDKKNDLIFHEFDHQRFEKGVWHQVKVIATDELNNTTEKEFRVFW